MLLSSQGASGLLLGAHSPVPGLRLRMGCAPVGLPLVLNDHVFLMDRLQQGSGQRLQVSDGLWSSWETAAMIIREQILN